MLFFSADDAQQLSMFQWTEPSDNGWLCHLKFFCYSILCKKKLNFSFLLVLADMAEGNGEIVDDTTKKSDDRGDGEKTEDYPKLLEYGLDKKVAAKLDDIYKTGKLAHTELDERALDALKEFPVDGALNVLSQFLESNLEHVSNKSAYLCGVMKTYRWEWLTVLTGNPWLTQYFQTKESSESARNSYTRRTSSGKRSRRRQNQGHSRAHRIHIGRHYRSVNFFHLFFRPRLTPQSSLLGQRKYGGPPPNWESAPPGNGCEVFCGKIPKDMYEDEIIPLFEKCGTIWDLRLMMDPMTGTNRGYAFITFTGREAAYNAVREVSVGCACFWLEWQRFHFEKCKTWEFFLSW